MILTYFKLSVKLRSHSLTALLQCNHHLVILLYLKFPFELCSYYYARTENHSPTRHYPPGTMKCCTKLLLSRFTCELAVLPWSCRTSHCGLKQKPSASVCLNRRVFGVYMTSKKLWLNYSKYVDQLLVVKTLIIIRSFGWKY